MYLVHFRFKLNLAHGLRTVGELLNDGSTDEQPLAIKSAVQWLGKVLNDLAGQWTATRMTRRLTSAENVECATDLKGRERKGRQGWMAANYCQFFVS